MNRIELDKAIDLSAYNDKGKKEIMKFFFCHPRIHETIKRQGAIDELEHYVVDLKRFELIADLEAKGSNIYSAINSLRISEEKRLVELKR